MATKVLLLLWIGVGSHQVLDVERFDTMAECISAAEALRKHDDRLNGKCIPYQTDIRFELQPY